MNYIDISHGLGVPFGGFGTGYFVFGRHGFVNFNLDGIPSSSKPLNILTERYGTIPQKILPAVRSLFMRI